MLETRDPLQAPAMRWGVIGPGWIAERFATALHSYTQSRITGVASRSPERLERFASRFNIDRVFGTYDGLVQHPDIDVIYIATPNSFHLEHAMLALSAGKSVLIEKPFAMNATEARQIAHAAERQGLFAMEAMWTRFLPHMDRLRHIVRSGRIGEIVSLRAENGKVVTPSNGHRLFDPSLGGGSLLDLGVYCVAFAHDILGTPNTLQSRFIRAATGVDAEANLLFEYESASAMLTSSLRADMAGAAVVHGTKGRVEIGGRFFHPSTLDVIVNGNEHVEHFDGRTELGFQYEAAEVAFAIADGRTESEIMPLGASIDIAGLLDSARQQM